MVFILLKLLKRVYYRFKYVYIIQSGRRIVLTFNVTTVEGLSQVSELWCLQSEYRGNLTLCEFEWDPNCIYIKPLFHFRHGFVMCDIELFNRIIQMINTSITDDNHNGVS